MTDKPELLENFVARIDAAMARGQDNFSRDDMNRALEAIARLYREMHAAQQAHTQLCLAFNSMFADRESECIWKH